MFGLADWFCPRRPKKEKIILKPVPPGLACLSTDYDDFELYRYRYRNSCQSPVKFNVNDINYNNPTEPIEIKQ